MDKKRLRAEVRLLKRVVISEEDMEWARKVVDRLLESDLDDLDRYAYETALVVIYCRPFSGNERKTSDKIGDLPDKSRKTFNDLERKVHDRVLKNYRNKLFAHSDSDAHGVTIGIHEVGGAKLAVPTKWAYKPMLSQADLQTLKKCIEKVSEYLLEEHWRIQSFLPEGHHT
ncbi:MAG TPA: hypothetical protein VGX03_15965 [Candidatus Binatia bacterium]|jgi:hypothetical protein|nr:hypothetical protein [Candidatus Binatia bacterium]